MATLLDNYKDKARKLGKHIVLPEARDDSRTIKAARMFLDEGLGTPVLIGTPGELLEAASASAVSLDGFKMIDPANYDRMDEMVALYQERRAKDKLSDEEVRGLLSDPLWFGAMLVKLGEADGMTAGAVNSTGNVLRASIRCIGTREGCRTVSSFFLMIVPDCEYGDDGVLFFADCGVIPKPTPEQLVDIGDSTALSYEKMMDNDPHVAYLSFSTKGSAKTDETLMMEKAARALAERRPGLAVDGELQADAALVPSVADRKCPGSRVAGKANILVFPDLGAGNIAYKLVQRLAKATAIGPILQGLELPVNDLSRGCSINDIVLVATITALQAG